MLGRIGGRGDDAAQRRAGAARGDRRGDRGRAAADADAQAFALDLDFGQAGFVEQLRELADQLLVDRGLVFGHAVVSQFMARSVARLVSA